MPEAPETTNGGADRAPVADTSTASLSESELARLAKWRTHLERRGTLIPDADDFRSFGRLSTLERLRKTLSAVEPAQCGPLGRVIAELKAEKRARTGGRVKRGERGPVRRRSIAAQDLREDWKRTLEEMRRARERVDQGLILFRETEPPAKSQIAAMEYILRSISRVCLDNGCAPALSKKTVRLWLEREADAERCETGVSMQLRQLARFLAYRHEKPKLRRRLAERARELAKIGRRQRKRKHQWLLENPTDVWKVWAIAEDLLRQSRAAPAGSRKRYDLALHAASIALSIAMPLRIGDLHRLRIGKEIERSAEGWRAEIVTQKTGGAYERPVLWPELTEFLDELLILEAPGGDLWTGYERRTGTPLFSRDGGRSALTADWISDVFYEHIGTGQHIMRTLWHQVAHDADTELTWMALALCGQRDKRTAKHYRQRNSRARATRSGRRTLAAIRQKEGEQAPSANTGA